VIDLFALLALAGAPAEPSVAERDQVIATVDQFLAAINSGDAKALDGVIHDDGVTFIQGYVEGRQGLRLRPNRESVAGITTATARYHERYWNPTVLVHRDIAQFWAPYSFDIDGKRSHCGVDSFSLARVDGKWLVTNLTYTVEPPERCIELGEPQ